MVWCGGGGLTNGALAWSPGGAAAERCGGAAGGGGHVEPRVPPLWPRPLPRGGQGGARPRHPRPEGRPT
eukprot:1911584-Pyramimonas_sp.AAC.1